jgi:hypothetical protein
MGLFDKGEGFYVTETLLIIAWSVFIIAGLQGDDTVKETIITISGNIVSCIGGYWLGSKIPLRPQKPEKDIKET